MLFEQDPVYLLLKIFLSTVMTLLMMASVTSFKYSKRRVILCFSVYLAYVMVFSVFFVLRFPWMVFLRIFVFAITLPAVVLIYLLARDSVTQAVFNYATQVDLFILLAVTGTLLNTAFHGNQVTDLILRFVLFGSAALLEFRFVRRPFCRLTGSLQSNWLPMALIPVAFCALLLLCGLFPVHYTESAWATVRIYMIFAVMGVVYLVVAGSLLKSYRLLEAKLEADVMNAQLHAPVRYMEKLLDGRRTLQKLRLGMAGMGKLLETGDTKKAREVLEELWAELSESAGEEICANPYINEVVSYYACRFERNHIPFTAAIELGDVKVPAPEVCLILNNVLENALEASLKLPEAERMVRLQAMPRQRQFLMRVSNRFDGRLTVRNGLPQSSRQEQGRGYGLTSVRAAAVGAGGDMVFHAEKGYFTLDVRVRTVSAQDKAV